MPDIHNPIINVFGGNIEHPIFIIGVHRSGTTLLRYMLNSHPNIYIPPESDFIPRFFLNIPHKILSKREINKFLTIIFSKYRFVREWKGEPPNIDIFLKIEVTPRVFLNTLYSLYAQQNNAQRWGDKTPIYCNYVNLIDTIFPESQIIHILRDGRDVALSMLDKWGNKDFHIDIYFTARNWVSRINQARTSGVRLGNNRYMEIYYENLVENPDYELRKICTFLGEEYMSIMSQPQYLGQKDIKPGSFHNPVRNPPSTSRINRWRHEMSQADLHIFQYIAGDLLNQLNYADVTTDNLILSSKERIRYIYLACKYQILQSGRKILQRLGLVPPI